MRVFHFVKRAYGLEDIRRRRVKIATFDDLNDPFELFSVDLSDESLRRQFRWLASTLNLSQGMICFSRKWNNPVQWSHYAEGHRGVCLAFDVPESNLLTVSYTRRRLVAEAQQIVASGRLDSHLIQRFLATKYSHWRYENESRWFVSLPVADSDSGLYFRPFSEQLSLTQVIVGALSCISRDELREALGDLAQSVQTLKARLAFGSFRVVRQRKQKLWR